MIMKVVAWGLNRLKEGSTWIGIGGFIALFNPAIGEAVGHYGVTVGTIMAGMLIGATTKG